MLRRHIVFARLLPADIRAFSAPPPFRCFSAIFAEFLPFHDYADYAFLWLSAEFDVSFYFRRA